MIIDTLPVPGNKNAILHKLIDGSSLFHCRTHQNPVSYGPMDNLKFIDLESLLNTSSKSVNGIWLRDKNIMSVGIRQDGLKNKFLGIRPDDNQTGSEQFEISIERIEYDGIEIPVDVASFTPIDSATSDLGNVIIQANRQRARQMVKVTSPIKHFRIIFTIHLKGLDYVRREDLDEEWFFSRKTGDFRLRLGKPLFIDFDNFEPLEGVQGLIKHTVKDNHDGTLTYIKEGAAGFSPDLLPASYLIDLDPIYSGTADGLVGNAGSTWATVRSAATGSTSSTTDSTSQYGILANNSSGTYNIRHAYFYFNTSGVTGTITAASVYLFGYTNAESNVCLMKGTQADTLTTADFDSFSGSSYGYGTLSTSGYTGISFDATGISDINTSGTSKICAREYAHDYGNSTPGTNAHYYNGIYLADNTGTTKDPYLSITVTASDFIPQIMIF